MNYTWAQRYITERIDLEKDGHLIGWITENRIDGGNNMGTGYYTRGCFGYIDQYKRVPAENAQYIYRVWWIQRDEKGYVIPKSGTDNINYASLKEAKQGLENHFGITEKDKINILPNNWNLSDGWNLPDALQ